MIANHISLILPTWTAEPISTVTLKHNGGTCIWEAVPAYVLWTNASLKWLY